MLTGTADLWRVNFPSDLGANEMERIHIVWAQMEGLLVGRKFGHCRFGACSFAVYV
jgi:hypothetical protein